MTTVASASRSLSIKWPTAGSSQPDQNYPNSITPTEEPTFSTLSAHCDVCHDVAICLVLGKADLQRTSPTGRS